MSFRLFPYLLRAKLGHGLLSGQYSKPPMKSELIEQVMKEEYKVFDLVCLVDIWLDLVHITLFTLTRCLSDQYPWCLVTFLRLIWDNLFGTFILTIFYNNRRSFIGKRRRQQQKRSHNKVQLSLILCKWAGTQCDYQWDCKHECTCGVLFWLVWLFVWEEPQYQIWTDLLYSKSYLIFLS